MFAYCLNNPVCMIDFEGENAIYVVDFTSNQGLPVVGHAILYLQDEEGNWYKSEFTGVFPDKSTAKISTRSVSEDDIQVFIENSTASAFYIPGDFSSSYELAKKYEDQKCGNFVNGVLSAIMKEQ